MGRGTYPHKPNQGFQKGHKFFRKNSICTEETKLKISMANKGRNHSPETQFKGKSKINVRCELCKKEFQVYEYETIRNKNFFCSQSCYWKSIQGENSPQWKGGISPYPLGWNRTFKEQIRYRDGYKCQLCGIPEPECCRKLDVHHIDYIKNNLHLNNLISLCRKCHGKTHHNREYWIEYFRNRIGDKNGTKTNSSIIE